MAEQLVRYSFLDILANNGGNAVTRVNAIARAMDAFLAGADVKTSTVLAQPGSPSEGDLHLLPETGTLTGADWSTFTNGNLALYLNDAWQEITSKKGMSVRDDEKGRHLVYNASNWLPPALHVESSITASTTQTQGQEPLTGEFNVVATVANANDVVTLPVAALGRSCVVVNRGANALQIFPASGDGVDDEATDASVTLAVDTMATFRAQDATTWYSQSGAGLS
ncbi:MAG: DUF2793 domain-containing protein [bacterium]|nr:DUF2793 domain-containing protein [bacterium]